MPQIDPPIDPRFSLHGDDPESVRAWANRIPGVGKWTLFSSIGYASPWADFSATDRPMRIRREFADIVRIEGVVKTTGNVSSGLNPTAITLPPQYRPQRTQDLPMHLGSDGVTAPPGFFFRIATTGVVSLAGYPLGAAATLQFVFFYGTYTISADK